MLLLVGCKQPPPPIADGRCLADSWVGATWPESPKAEKQVCLYQGVIWRCDAMTCTRTTEDPRAVFPSEKP